MILDSLCWCFFLSVGKDEVWDEKKNQLFRLKVSER